MNSWLTSTGGPALSSFPLGQAYLGDPDLPWPHAVADAIIAVGCWSIPLTLAYFVHLRRDIPYRPVFLLFGGFIAACGVLHALGALEASNALGVNAPLGGVARAVTALLSAATAVTLIRIMPAALRLPGPMELRRLNETLEESVRHRTADLEAANAALRREAAERQRAETEIGRLNTELRQRVNELQTLFNVLPVGVGIAEDAACQVIRTNDAFARMLGMPREANASMTAPASAAAAVFSVYHQGEPIEPRNLPMQVCTRENRTVVNFEEVIERHDGTRFEVLANAVPLRDAAGQVTGCVATFQDITPLKTALAANARYAAIVASSEDAIIGRTLGGQVTDWNHAAEKLFGYAAAEMIGQPIRRLFSDDRLDEETAIIQRISRGETIPPVETVRRRKDGTLVHVSVIVSPIRDPAGRIVGASKSVRDITERKRAEAQRQEMERRIQETQKLESLGVLAGGIAHDFNNLLTGILGNASLARTDLAPSTPCYVAVDQIIQAARRAADLCRQMLAYSGRGHFIVQRLDLNHLVKDTTHLLGLSISKQCTLEFRLAPVLPAISADATQIRQIVMNLVINASEALGDRGGSITLATAVHTLDREFLATIRHDGGCVPGDHVCLEVRDTGKGMDPATLERIFDPFFTTKFTGRGLGLAAVLGIVRGHRGALKVESEPGRGTTFQLFLPTSPGPADAAPAAPGSLTPFPARSGHVLVIDDEETVRTVAARILEDLGYGVETAQGGAEAIGRFRAQPDRYHLILLDLTMPQPDGEETFRQLRAILPDVRVVLMSGFDEKEALGRFTGQGLAGFVQKPFDLQALSAALRHVRAPG